MTVRATLALLLAALATPAAVPASGPWRIRSPAEGAGFAALAMPSAAAAASGPRRILSPADRASFAALAARLGGEQGLAVSATGRGQPVQRLGSLRSAVAWSTAKVPVVMAALAAGRAGPDSPDVVAAITASDNAAAMRVWNLLGGGPAAAAAADAQLRAAGDERTAIEHRTVRSGFTPFGQTRWRLSDQTRFTAGLACLPAGAQVLSLMGQVIPAQRWGLGAAGVPAQLKGGWGPGAGGAYLDRQMGVVTLHGRPLAVALASRPADGTHTTATADLTRLARWLVAHADARAASSTPAC